MGSSGCTVLCLFQINSVSPLTMHADICSVLTVIMMSQKHFTKLRHPCNFPKQEEGFKGTEGNWEHSEEKLGANRFMLLKSLSFMYLKKCLFEKNRFSFPMKLWSLELMSGKS